MRTMAAAAASALLLTTGCSDDAPPGPSTRPSGSATTRPERLVYMNGKRLSFADLTTVAKGVIATLPSADTALSPDGTRFVVTGDRSNQPIGDEGFTDPVLILAPVEEESGTPQILGPGRAPVWSPDGSAIAAVHEDGIAVYDADGGAEQRPEVVLGPGEWSIVGWSGDRIVGVPFGTGDAAVADPASPSPEPKSLGFGADHLWGISPQGPTALLVSDEGTVLRTEEGDEITVELAGAAPGDGAWAPDEATIALAAIAASGNDNYLALIDTETAEVTRVPESEGAQGDVVWSADSSWFAFAKVATADPGKLEAVVCSLELDCESELTWREGIDLLALTGESGDGS